MSNSKDYHLGNLKPLIIALMTEEGRLDGSDSAICEQCLEYATPYEIHHTKYKDATYYDLQVVCRSCNRIAANVGLA